MQRPALACLPSAGRWSLALAAALRCAVLYRRGGSTPSGEQTVAPRRATPSSCRAAAGACCSCAPLQTRVLAPPPNGAVRQRPRRRPPSSPAPPAEVLRPAARRRNGPAAALRSSPAAARRRPPLLRGPAAAQQRPMLQVLTARRRCRSCCLRRGGLEAWGPLCAWPPSCPRTRCCSGCRRRRRAASTRDGASRCASFCCADLPPQCKRGRADNVLAVSACAPLPPEPSLPAPLPPPCLQVSAGQETAYWGKLDHAVAAVAGDVVLAWRRCRRGATGQEVGAVRPAGLRARMPGATLQCSAAGQEYGQGKKADDDLTHPWVASSLACSWAPTKRGTCLRRATRRTGRC